MVEGNGLFVLPGQRSGVIPLLRGLPSAVLLWMRQQRILQLFVLVLLMSLPVDHHL
jgi:hypothetical protein